MVKKVYIGVKVWSIRAGPEFSRKSAVPEKKPGVSGSS
jgi:hypothetical protein